jgi:hypothetical protein
MILGFSGAAAVVLGIVMVSRHPATRSPDPPDTGDSPEPGLPWFVDVTRSAGIDFQHFDPATPRHYIQETMGSGLAWIDYDNDGWPDLFCVQDGPVFPKAGGPAPTNKLYRNNGDGTFTDVTERVGLARSGYGMGVAVGDFDNDGYDDLLVTYFGGLVLYHNEPDGQGRRRFVDVTERSGLRNPHWATSAAWGDVDGDGYLDLYVCNYCEVDLDKYPVCEEGQPRRPVSCPPWVFPAVTHRLYRNNRNGTFTDISKPSGVAAAPPAPGLGVVMADLDGDGRIDIYVANDMRPAYLFHNQGGGRFVEKALYAGCGLGPGGREVAGMGVDAGDVDGSGRPSLFVTNFHFVPNVLYLNAGRLFFHDWTERSGLGPPSIDRLGFGTVFCDVDLDGRLDLAVANGHVSRNSTEVFRAAFAQEAQLFLGLGSGRFRDVSPRAGAYFRERRVGRGLALADFNNDGKPDLVFSHNGGPITLLENRTETANGWLGLDLRGDGRRSNRNAIGARVEVEAAGSRQVRFVNGGGSYLSASDRRVLVGLGPAQRADRVTVRWPSGREQTFRDLEGRRWWRLEEGSDRPAERRPTPRGGPG